MLDERYCIGKQSNNGSGGSTTNNRCASISGAAAGNTTGNATSTSSISSGTNSLEVITIPRDVIRIVTQTDVGELEIMRVNPLHVAEGDSVIITPRHLTITLDLSKFGIRESGVLFRISKQPQQGRIEVLYKIPIYLQKNILLSLSISPIYRIYINVVSTRLSLFSVINC